LIQEAIRAEEDLLSSDEFKKETWGRVRVYLQETEVNLRKTLEEIDSLRRFIQTIKDTPRSAGILDVDGYLLEASLNYLHDTDPRFRHFERNNNDAE
jgi:hypothetical protein